MKSFFYSLIYSHVAPSHPTQCDSDGRLFDSCNGVWSYFDPMSSAHNEHEFNAKNHSEMCALAFCHFQWCDEATEYDLELKWKCRRKEKKKSTSQARNEHLSSPHHNCRATPLHSISSVRFFLSVAFKLTSIYFVAKVVYAGRIFHRIFAMPISKTSHSTRIYVIWTSYQQERM